MKATILVATAAFLAGGAALAQPATPRTTTICLDVGGRQQPVTCYSQSASRLDRSEDICQCFHSGRPVTVDVCPEGVNPPAESAVYERERYALVQDGSLVGKTWRGRPVCVAPHRGG
ncbi:MAG: hypothetical protein KGO51_07160 [Alphaproteobacteria bacterium]|nr:hypothetical protein [Alphaproteobacteria bacterium]